MTFQSEFQEPLFPSLDSNLAPPGFIAVKKADRGATEETQSRNICTFCDWRPYCQRWENGYTFDPRYRCMSWARPDGESVIFKKATDDTQIQIDSEAEM